MNVRRNASKPASFTLLVMLAALMLLTAAFPACAEETFTYQGTTLTLDPSEDKLSIRLTPQLLGLWDTYYYTPDDDTQKELRTLLDELKLLNYTIDEKFWEEHPEAGYTIVDAANHTEWMMLAGDHLLYTMFETGEGFAFMHRRYAKCEDLVVYLQPMMDSLLQYTSFDVTTLTGLTAATITMADGRTETVTDAAVLAQIEEWFSEAAYIRAPSCPNGDGMLYLTTGAGTTAELLLAVDECPYFSINGIYYDYTPAKIRKEQQPGDVYPNNFLFDLFPGIQFEPVDLHP